MNAEPGTYALVFRSTTTRNVKIGRLGTISLQPGYWIYVGSAFGPGGLRARITRHRKRRGPKHWHIDYLKPWLDLTDIWYTHDPVRREHQWAETLLAGTGSLTPLPGFGSSDCKCATHLVCFESKPDFGRSREALGHGALERAAIEFTLVE